MKSRKVSSAEPTFVSTLGDTPRRRTVAGIQIYCSPACGRGCKRDWYNAAMSNGAKLRAVLNELTKDNVLQLRSFVGDGTWHTRVWENLGWHYKCVSPCGRLKVYATHYDKTIHYTAFLGEGDGGRWAEDGKTPRAAIAAVFARARTELLGIERLLAPRKPPVKLP